MYYKNQDIDHLAVSLSTTTIPATDIRSSSYHATNYNNTHKMNFTDSVTYDK